MSVQNKNIIKISDEYGISVDDMNIILYSRKTNNTETSKNFGKEYYQAIGYYSSIDSLLKSLGNKKVQLSVTGEQSLEDVVKSVDKSVDKLYSNVLEVVKHIRENTTP